jgi:hypothetical protein
MNYQGNNPVLPNPSTSGLAQEIADLRAAVETEPAWKINKAVQDAKREFWLLPDCDEAVVDVLDLIDSRVGDLPPHSLGRCKARCLVACVESLLEFID